MNRCNDVGAGCDFSLLLLFGSVLFGSWRFVFRIQRSVRVLFANFLGIQWLMNALTLLGDVEMCSEEWTPTNPPFNAIPTRTV